MTTNKEPQITAGRVSLTQQDDDKIVLVYASKQGPVTIIIEAAKLERWAMRLMREETFA